jgi:hypothetical protein
MLSWFQTKQNAVEDAKPKNKYCVAELSYVLRKVYVNVKIVFTDGTISKFKIWGQIGDGTMEPINLTDGACYNGYYKKLDREHIGWVHTIEPYMCSPQSIGLHPETICYTLDDGTNHTVFSSSIKGIYTSPIVESDETVTVTKKLLMPIEKEDLDV